MKIVQKYGGSSLADDTCVRRVAQRIAADAVQNDMLVVVSAQGKTTDALTERYKTLSKEFPSRESDRLLVTGEQASAALLAAALEDIGIAAVSLNAAEVPIVATGAFGNGYICRIGKRRIRREWKRKRVVIVTGFQGISRKRDYITLGRGGSDTSAVALAGELDADKCMIFTDVDGVYSADPRKIPDARRFSSIHIDTMLALARNGAKVLHPGAVILAKKYGIDLTVLTSFSLASGTLVSQFAPRRTGITVSYEGDIATVCIVFSQSPEIRVLNSLKDFCAEYGAVPREEECLLFASLPAGEENALVWRLHDFLYLPSA